MSRPKGSKNSATAVGRHQGMKKKSRYEPRITLEEACAQFNAAFDNVFCATRPWLTYERGRFAA